MRICIRTSWKKKRKSRRHPKIKKETGPKSTSEQFKMCNDAVAAIKKRNWGIQIKNEEMGSTSTLTWCYIIHSCTVPYSSIMTRPQLLQKLLLLNYKIFFTSVKKIIISTNFPFFEFSSFLSIVHIHLPYSSSTVIVHIQLPWSSSIVIFNMTDMMQLLCIFHYPTTKKTTLR